MPCYVFWLLITFVIALHLSLALCERDSVGFIAIFVSATVYIGVPFWQCSEKGEPDRTNVLFLCWLHPLSPLTGEGAESIHSSATRANLH